LSDTLARTVRTVTRSSILSTLLRAIPASSRRMLLIFWSGCKAGNRQAGGRQGIDAGSPYRPPPSSAVIHGMAMKLPIMPPRLDRRNTSRMWVTLFV